MNEVIDTSIRVFMAIVGPSGSGKTELILKLLMGNSLLNLEPFYIFTKRCNLHSQKKFLLRNCEVHKIQRIRIFRKFRKCSSSFR